MKKNLILLAGISLISLSVGFTSCKPDYETKFDVYTLTVPNNSLAPILFDRSGDNKEIPVETNVAFDNWYAESNADWCKVSKVKDKVTITAEQNPLYSLRYAKVKIYYGHQAYDIPVRQFGKDIHLTFGNTVDEATRDKYEVSMSGSAESVSIPMYTNMLIDHILVPDTCPWIKYVPSSNDLPTGDQPLNFEVEANLDTVPRLCTVTVQSSQNYSAVGKFLIRQEARGVVVIPASPDSLPLFKTDHLDIQVPAAGQKVSIPFFTNGIVAEAYTITIEDSAKSWITTSSLNLRALTQVSEGFQIAANINPTPRTGTITFTSTDPSENSSFVVTISQEKFVPVPPFNVSSIEATPGAGYIDISWNLPDEVNYSKLVISYTDKVLGHEVTKELSNRDTSIRIEDTYAVHGDYTFKFMTYGPTGMATNDVQTITTHSNAAPNLLPVKLTEAMISENGNMPGDGGGKGAMVDGNKQSFYHTKWNGPNPDHRHYVVQFELEKPVPGVTFEYDERRAGNALNNSGSPKVVEVYVSETGNPVTTDNGWTKAGVLNYDMGQNDHMKPMGDAVVHFDKPYKYIRFVPISRRSRETLDFTSAQGWWNLSQLYMYAVNSKNESWAQSQIK